MQSKFFTVFVVNKFTIYQKNNWIAFSTFVAFDLIDQDQPNKCIQVCASTNNFLKKGT